jgi:hypothetical protein
MTRLWRAEAGGEKLDPLQDFLLLSLSNWTGVLVKGEVAMRKPRARLYSRLPLLLAALLLLLVAGASWAQEFKEYYSEEYGFTMKYPATWVKIDKPKGNYYVVFQSPDLLDSFRPRVHVAAHKPVKDPINVFLQEMRNGIQDLQKKAGGSAEKQQVRILDEGEFKCEVPGAYYFFIQALEEKLKIWMDIVIVFYKSDQTLLRISCLAPSQHMEKFHQIFNEMLVSVKFGAPEEEAAEPPTGAAPPPPPPSAPPARVPQPGTTPTVTPRPQAAPPASVPGPPSVARPQPPAATTVTPPPAPKAGPRGPQREPERPATGIVN